MSGEFVSGMGLGLRGCPWGGGIAVGPRGWGLPSEQQRVAEVEGWCHPEGAEKPTSRLSESVDADAVRLGIDLVGELGHKLFQLSGVQHAFEHRLLNTLSVPLADMCDMPEPAAPLQRVRGDIVCNDNFHNATDTERVDSGRGHHGGGGRGAVPEHAVQARGVGVVGRLCGVAPRSFGFDTLELLFFCLPR